MALFGPSWPERAGPWGHGHRVLQGWRSPNYHAFRDPESALGMAAIGVEEVFAAISEQLASDGPGRRQHGSAAR